MGDVATERHGPGLASQGAGAPHDRAEDGVAPPEAPRPQAGRAAAFAAGPPPFPRKLLYGIIGTVVVVAVFVAVVNRLASSSPSGSGTFNTERGAVGGSVAPAGSAQLHAPLSALLGIIKLSGATPAPWSLTDAATGQAVSLASLRGRVVVLTFVNAACNDICPVLGAELAKARSLLGSTGVPVTFVTVNTDPLALATTQAKVLTAGPFSDLAGWRFLTGDLAELNKVWTAYGISVRVNTATRRVSHNDLMYFVAPDGKLAWSAVPFADEAKDGSSSLSPSVIARFGEGIATYAGKLAHTP